MDKERFAWYGIDTEKNLNLSAICNRPFGTVLIDKVGDVYLCDCQAWLPFVVGNLHKDSLENIFENNKSEYIRDTILDGSYKFCNNKQCIFLNNEFIQRQATLVPPVQLVNIRLGIDESCNLSCPSCRTKTIFDKDNESIRKKIKIADKVIEYLKAKDSGVQINIGSDGDPFASLVYRYFMRNVPKKGSIRYGMQTNGLLLKKMMYRYPHVFENMDLLKVSVDGATKQTYEKLRRGGRWENLLENLEHISKIKNQYRMQWHIDYVVQLTNFREIPQLLDLAEKLNIDAVNLTPIQNWNTYADIGVHQIWKKDNVHYNEYQSIMESIKDHPKINSRNFLWTIT